MEVKNGQSLLDIAMQETGAAEDALQLALMNGICLTDELLTGTDLEIPETENEDRDNVEFYRERGILPATATTKEQEALNPYGGIEYMGIEIDFIVS